MARRTPCRNQQWRNRRPTWMKLTSPVRVCNVAMRSRLFPPHTLLRLKPQKEIRFQMATANALLGCTSDDSLQLPLGTSNLTPITDKLSRSRWQ